MIVAGIASLSTRERLLEQAVASLLPQVDALCVYLNGYEQIPGFLRHPKVLYAVLSRESGYRGGEAKLWFFDAGAFKAVPAPWTPDTIALTADDDIIYPPDYAARMVAALDRRPGTVACVHASILTEPFRGWRESRRNVHFGRGLAADARIHVPGTGTMAFRVRDWPYSVHRDHAWSHCCDVAAAVFAQRRGIEIWAVARPDRWLRALAPPSTGTAISRARIAANVDEVETRLLREAGPWPELPVPTEFRGRQAPAVRAGRAAWLRRAASARAAAPVVAPVAPAPVGRNEPPIHFAIIAPGWSCADRVLPFWRSIEAQRGAFTWEAHVYDDGSEDDTWQAIAALPDDPRLRRSRGEANLGAAHARHRLIADVAGAEAVVALVDLDDELEPGALARVAREYREHPGTWATYGSWRADCPGGRRQEAGQAPYPPAVVAARSYRRHTFLAGPLRTFRRHMVDGVPQAYLQDADGAWLRCGTDLALMASVLEQCPSERVRRIPDVLYRYTWRRPTGTMARYGPEAKAAVRSHLFTLPPLPLKAA